MATKIHIINFSCDAVAVNFPLLYIHGQIDSKSGSVTCVNETTNKQEEWPIICGMFKVLCFLEEGFNKIRLNSDSVENACKTFSATCNKLMRKRYLLPVYVICKNSDGAFICPDDDSTEVKSKHLPALRRFADNGKTDERKEEIENSVRSIVYGENISQKQVLKNGTNGERFTDNEVPQSEVKSTVKKQDFKLEKENIISSNYANRVLQLPTHVKENAIKNGFKPQHENNSVAHAVKRLKLNCRMMQTFFAESLFEHTFQRKTFRLLEEKDGSPLIQLFHSKLDICDVPGMTGGELYDFFHKEIVEGLGENPYCKYLVFMSCTRYYPPNDGTEYHAKDVMTYVKGHAALGGGNMALFGTGSLHTWASDLYEVTERFTDQRIIDGRKFFDDSCGRGSYWANYSTTLGAAIHELGHCFDLAHTPHGIMARGHDDMNHFFTVVSGEQGQESYQEDQLKNISTVAVHGTTDDHGKYRGAHWYRPSAVILNYNSWFNDDSVEGTLTKSTSWNLHSQLLERAQNISLSLHPDLLGPFGIDTKNTEVGCDTSEHAGKQPVFNSFDWLQRNDLIFNGIVFYYSEYIYGIRFLGTNVKSDEDGSDIAQDREYFTPIFGSYPPHCKKHLFKLSYSDEIIEKIIVASGAWVDGIQIVTNYKSTIWIGGNGGSLYVEKITKHKSIKSFFGTATTYLNSLYILLERANQFSKSRTESTALTNQTAMEKQEAAEKSKISLTLTSMRGIRLVEFRKENGEIKYFEEYLDPRPPYEVVISLTKLIQDNRAEELLSGMAYDNGGGNRNFSFSKEDLESICEQVSRSMRWKEFHEK